MKDLALSPFADEDPGVREVASSSLLPCPPQCQGPAELGGGRRLVSTSIPVESSSVCVTRAGCLSLVMVGPAES